MVEFFSQITYWHWFILGVVLIVVEMLAPGAMFLWLGLTAIGTGLAVVAIPTISWQMQLVIFGIASPAVIFGGRMLVARRTGPSDHPELNQRGMGYVGRSYRLTEPVANGIGKLVIDDTQWRIAGADAPAGAMVKVVGMDGTTLLVEPIAG
jgi:inner membrane protein